MRSSLGFSVTVLQYATAGLGDQYLFGFDIGLLLSPSTKPFESLRPLQMPREQASVLIIIKHISITTYT
jgi:hypothetical protein